MSDLPAYKTPYKEACMDRIVTKYGDQILRFCMMYLGGDRYLAEDAAQETFLAVFQNYGTFKQDSSELTWITRIAINKCKNIRRKKFFQLEIPGGQTETSNLYSAGLGAPGQMGLKPYPWASVSTTAEEGHNNNAILSSSIQKLPKKEREAILLYYYQELEVQEIASLCSIKENTVRQRLKRGRDKLKSMLEELGIHG
ncbi:sigma-70 family RNA polymerase sigma factor [Lachnospiraceae bacterium 29-84]